MKFVSNILSEDIKSLITDCCIPWFEFTNSTVFITGATGLVGSMLVRTLSSANKEQNLNIRILTHGRNRIKGSELVREFDAEFIAGDICHQIPSESLPPTINYIFHCAAITKSADMIAKPVDVIRTESEGISQMLRIAKEKNCKSFTYLSSMEIYGQTDSSELKENNLGYLDLADPRSCYPLGKRFAETLCNAYTIQFDLPVKIARLSQTFGAGTPKDDTRVFAQFARSALAGRNIELHTMGTSRGNYCYIADSIRALLIVLLKGKNGETYNVSNPDASTTIYEMAKIVATDIYLNKINVVVDIPEDISKRGYAPDVNYTLNIDKIKALGWVPRYGLEDMYKRMLNDWRYHQ